MQYARTLSIDFDDDTNRVNFRTPVHSASEACSFRLPAGFVVHDVLEAVLATGWVVRRGPEFYLGDTADCDSLRALVQQMFAYFDATGEPNEQLLQVKEAVSEYHLVQDTQPVISLWGYAWLDVVVRDDIAEDARTQGNIWSSGNIEVNADRHRDRRIAELVQRYSDASESTSTQHLAPSQRVRPSRAIGKTG